jgi:hypothetical protein
MPPISSSHFGLPQQRRDVRVACRRVYALPTCVPSCSTIPIAVRLVLGGLIGLALYRALRAWATRAPLDDGPAQLRSARSRCGRPPSSSANTPRAPL